MRIDEQTEAHAVAVYSKRVMPIMQVSLQSAGLIDFNVLRVRAASTDGGRVLFERMIVDLVGVRYPEVSTIEANPGDWGIDAYVGQLFDDEVSVWQSKYFIDGFDKSQQAQVRDAYESALKSAKEHGYSLATWTLCMPCNFDGPNEQWWKKWKNKKEGEDSVVIDLWNEAKLRRLLIAEDARAVRDHYFNALATVPDTPTRPVVTLQDPDRYDGALFVRQMHEAGMLACDEAKEEFFNAEILSTEIADKAVPEEISALVDSRAAVASLWSQRFNSALQSHPGRQLPGLYERAMDAVRQHHPALPKVISCGLIHAFGLVHQRVNDGRAGWVRDFQQIARQHAEHSTSGALVAPSGVPQADTLSQDTVEQKEGEGS
ncbi:serine/threonine protein kinase [Streptomyces collinus]|uniref:serine/threonine protein kinase n=1 Tax=Streptomyces collinus TaxID=42684 RepID=UPI003817BBB8